MAFAINNVLINGEIQVCTRNNQQVWPLGSQTNDKVEESTTMIDTNEESSSSDSCGTIKQVNNFGNSFPLPSIPGQFPWVVAIYRYFNDDDESYYKCSGTIIDKRTILTSVNCLLEDGLLLRPCDIQVHISPFNLQSKAQQSRIFEADEFITHESFNLYLDNNIAVLKLAQEIPFNNFVQPICLPTENYAPQGKIGKVCDSRSLSENFTTKLIFYLAGRFRKALINNSRKIFSHDGSGIRYQKYK